MSDMIDMYRDLRAFRRLRRARSVARALSANPNSQSGSRRYLSRVSDAGFIVLLMSILARL